MSTKTFLKELRDAAAQCTKIEYRRALTEAADSLQGIQAAFSAWPSRERMIALNCAWAYSERLLATLPAEADPMPPLAGAPEAARLAA